MVLVASTLFFLTGEVGAQKRVRSGNLVVEQPWVRASTAKNRPATAYLTIRNRGKKNDTLLKVSTPLSESAEVHSTTKNSGATRKSRVWPVKIPGGGKVVLAPGGLHIKMTNLKAPLVKGKTVELTIWFIRAGKITVTAPIYGPGAIRPIQPK